MRTPIVGVAPPELAEATSTVVWPSIGAYGLGRLVGRWCGVRIGYGFFTLGKLLALLTIPLSLGVYLWKILPFICRRYRLTNRRIVIQKGYSAKDAASVALDAFDAIEIQVRTGQSWLRCGDVLFVRRESPGSTAQEVLRLPAVPRPEVFRQLCLETQSATLSVRNVLRAQLA